MYMDNISHQMVILMHQILSDHIRNASTKIVHHIQCNCTEQILMLLKYYSSLQINSNKQDHTSIINFIHTKYTVSQLIMDHFHFPKHHDHHIQDMMNIAMGQHQLPSCDIHACPHSARLYRFENKSAEIEILDEEDKESVLGVMMVCSNSLSIDVGIGLYVFDEGNHRFEISR